jgi:hypothetical protein
MNIRLGGLGWYMTYQQKTNHFDFLCTPTEPNYGLLYRLYRCHISLYNYRSFFVVSFPFLSPFICNFFLLEFVGKKKVSKNFDLLFSF